ncbi:peptide/nickel transport system substrate-binding protein [Dongia mobilis]|uniref:Peptide/nickel transport system substrate-binding protein n=1 Tax=Dongia mobilis TaxID=578943 RepID=A0A4R6WT50_9PROT|nr:ABC transporter substrate-binding protein [Dongia mobilis]TDQ86436.1 peptide/nickel transport system substrate-binding protein [Dongia mobilis]
MKHLRARISRVLGLVLAAPAVLALATLPALAAEGARFIGAPLFAEAEKAGDLPPVAERLPEQPLVTDMPAIGRHGGEIRTLMASPKDSRILVAYSYARLVGYDRNFELKPDLLESFEVAEGRIFTLHLRKGHRWSNGKPFTTEDFRFWWEDVANNEELFPVGPPAVLIVDGEKPQVEVIDEFTIRYSWSQPNTEFLPALAGATPLYIYQPAKYMKKFHAKYADPAELEAAVKDSGQPSWAALYNRRGNQYRNDNPKLPTLDPWVLRIKPPADRLVFVRNPYYHRVDRNGRQLPYLDQVVMDVADSKLIPAKVAAGESDLQARYLRFDNYTFLKKAEKEGRFALHLWEDSRGSNFALFPNLNCNDEEWRKLNRDVRFRRALSLGVNRHEINQAIYYGLGKEGANTVQEMSPLFRSQYRLSWSVFDLSTANRLLDEIGLTERDDEGYRRLPDGRRMTIIIETAGESTEETDILQLIKDSWRELGIDIFTKPSQREVFRDRIFTGETIMSVSFGVDNGIPTPDMSPKEFAPSTQQQYMWPKWGQYIETQGASGTPIDLPEAQELADLLAQWRGSADADERREIWDRILAIWSEQVYSIGTVTNIPQPVIVDKSIRNLPDQGMWAWDPGAHFGVYRIDCLWRELAPEALASLSPVEDRLQ